MGERSKTLSKRLLPEWELSFRCAYKRLVNHVKAIYEVSQRPLSG